MENVMRLGVWVFRVLLVVCVASFCAPSAMAAIIFGETATASSAYTAIDRGPERAIDGSGLVGDAHVRWHPDGTMWLTDYMGPTGDPDPWYQVDLGAVYTISAMHVWNYNESTTEGGGSPRGVKDVGIYSSLTGAATTFRQSFVFAPASGSHSYTGEDIVFDTAFDARYVKFDINSNHGQGVFYGLSEVQFEGAAPIPEPSTLIIWSLLGALGIGYGWYRRRRKGSASEYSSWLLPRNHTLARLFGVHSRAAFEEFLDRLERGQDRLVIGIALRLENRLAAAFRATGRFRQGS